MPAHVDTPESVRDAFDAAVAVLETEGFSEEAQVIRAALSVVEAAMVWRERRGLGFLESYEAKLRAALANLPTEEAR